MSITIFNSDTKVWKVQENREGKGFSINNGEHHHGHISFNVRGEDYAENMDTNVLENIGSSWVLFDKGVKVRYSDKEMQPYGIATPSRSTGDSLIAVAIDVKPGYELTSFYNEHAHVYKTNIDVHKHVQFIANMTNRRKNLRSPRISITLVNEKEQKVIAYSIFWGRNFKLIVNTKNVDFKDIPPKGERGHISTVNFAKRAVESGREIVPLFQPSSPTNLIVVATALKDKAVKAINDHKYWHRAGQYNIVTVEKSEDVEQLSKDGYKAVTLYFEEEVSEDFVTNVMNNQIFEKSMRLFDTVYVTGGAGSYIVKAKVNGSKPKPKK